MTRWKRWDIRVEVKSGVCVERRRLTQSPGETGDGCHSSTVTLDIRLVVLREGVYWVPTS